MLLEIAYIVLLLVYVSTIVSTILLLLIENRNPVKSIAWIFVLLFVPIGGFVCYILFGKKFRKKRIINKRSIRLVKSYEEIAQRDVSVLNLTDMQRSLVNLAINNSDAPFFEKNQIKLYTNATLLYEQIFEDIKKATHHINVEYYVFSPDNLGRRMMDALIEKSKEGVQVRLIVDDVGSWNFKKSHEKELRDAGIEVERFLEVGLSFISSRVNYRNHRKILVIDGKVGYTGGINVADRYVKGLSWGTWRDTHARYEGGVVLGLQRAFFEDWFFVRQSLIDDSVYYPAPSQEGTVRIQTVVSGPDMPWTSIMQMFTKSFSMAKKRIFIETPYFMPPEALMESMQTAALSGVDVRLILPRRSDAPLTLLSSHSYLDAMFKAGIKVYFYHPGFIHSKITIVDDEVGFIGSANMDFRSFEQNFELNTVIYDKEVVAQLVSIYEQDLSDSLKVEESSWKTRPKKMKVKESLARLCSPLL